MTPALRTEDEHPLLMRDLVLADRYFDERHNHFFTLHSLLAAPFRDTSIFHGLITAFEAADRLVFRALLPARRLAWQAVIELARPRRADGRPYLRRRGKVCPPRARLRSTNTATTYVLSITIVARCTELWRQRCERR